MENKFAENLSKFRKLNHLSREELAKKIGVSGRTIFHYESGFNEPDINTLIRLAEALEVSLDELVYGGFIDSSTGGFIVLDPQFAEQCFLVSKEMFTLCKKLARRSD